MALSSKLPPQAYTRDTLVKAIEWLSVQPPTLRESVKSADLIVSHYLQARRQNPSSSESPLQQESFKLDLKTLADELREPQESAPKKRSPSILRSSHNLVHEKKEASMSSSSSMESFFRPSHSQVPDTIPQHQPMIQQSLPLNNPPPSQQHQRPQMEASIQGLSWNVDARSLSIARELRDRLNLSCEGEALRMLVSLGAERFKGVLP